MISRFLATLLTYILAGAMTLAVALSTFILAPPIRYLLVALHCPPQWSPFEWIPRAWAAMFMFIMRYVLFIRIKIEGHLPRFEKGSHVVLLANHGSSLEMFFWGWYAVNYLRARVSVVIDRSNMTNPVGWALRGIGASIFISRKDPVTARELIRRGIIEVLGPRRYPRVIAICPDGGRPKPASIARDLKRHPECADWIGPVLLPREAGTDLLLDGLDSISAPYYVVTTTVAFGEGQNIGVASLYRLFGSTMYIEARDIRDEIPYLREERRQWLNIEWARKSRLIRSWRALHAHPRWSVPRLVFADVCIVFATIIPFIV